MKKQKTVHRLPNIWHNAKETKPEENTNIFVKVPVKGTTNKFEIHFAQYKNAKFHIINKQITATVAFWIPIQFK